MDGFFYVVFRFFYKGATETHSTQFFTDKRQATQRFYNIIAQDLADDDITFQYVELKDCFSNDVDGIRPVIYDRRPQPIPPTE